MNDVGHGATAAATDVLLSARGLVKAFAVGRTWVPGSGASLRAVDDVDLAVRRGETLGLVGESGSGKSTLGRCLTRLHDLDGGDLHLDGQDIGTLSGRRLRPVRGRLQMIFQDPSASLNPRRRVREILADPLALTLARDVGRRSGGGAGRGRRGRRARLEALMDLVGLPAAHLERYPHEFSGGQRQRIGIARALAMEPDLIVADEPVSALDVSVQAQIVNLFAELRERLGLTYVFIAHDLGVVRQVSTRVAIMYLGSIVESGPTDAVFEAPAHPYTEALISAIPVPTVGAAARRDRIILEGEIPSPVSPPPGCKFVTRCPAAEERCRRERPVRRDIGGTRDVACHFPRIAVPPVPASSAPASSLPASPATKAESPEGARPVSRGQGPSP